MSFPFVCRFCGGGVSLFDDGRGPDAPHRPQGVVGHQQQEGASGAVAVRGGIETHLDAGRTAGRDRKTRFERGGKPFAALYGPDDQVAAARVRERQRLRRAGTVVFHGAELHHVGRYLAPGCLLLGHVGGVVRSDAVRHDRRAAAAAVHEKLQRVAQCAVTGGVGRDEVGDVDRAACTRGDPFGRVDTQQAAAYRGIGTELETYRAVRRVYIAHGRLHPDAGIYVSEGAERRIQAQSAAGIDRIKLFDALRPRDDFAADRERGDAFAVGGVDPQLLVEGSGAVRRIVAHGDLRPVAGQDRPLREAGNRAAARGRHIENHQRPVAPVYSREGVPHRPVGLADGAEVPDGRFEDQLRPFLLRCDARGGQCADNERYDRFSVHVSTFGVLAKVHFLRKKRAIILRD